jgi:hypothetical protein
MGDRGDRVCAASPSLDSSQFYSPSTVLRDQDLYREYVCNQRDQAGYYAKKDPPDLPAKISALSVFFLLYGHAPSLIVRSSYANTRLLRRFLRDGCRLIGARTRVGYRGVRLVSLTTLLPASGANSARARLATSFALSVASRALSFASPLALIPK